MFSEAWTGLSYVLPIVHLAIRVWFTFETIELRGHSVLWQRHRKESFTYDQQ